LECERVIYKKEEFNEVLQMGTLKLPLF